MGLLLLLIAQIIIAFRYPTENLFYFLLFLNAAIMFFLLDMGKLPYFLAFWIILLLCLGKASIPPLGVLLEMQIASIPEISYLFLFLIPLSLLLFTGLPLCFVLLEGRKLSLDEVLSLSLGLGAGANSIILIILGHFRLLNLGAILPLQLGLALATLLLLLLEKMRSPEIYISKPRFTTLLLVSPLLLGSLIHAIFFPELYWDSLAYGVTWAKLIYLNGGIPLIAGGPSLGLELSSNFPSAFQVLGAYFYNFTGENPHVLRLLALIFTLAFLSISYRWSSELLGLRERKIFLLFLCLIPVVLLYSRYSIWYSYVLFQFTLAMRFLHYFLRSGKLRELLLAFGFGSFAALASYLGLIFLPLSFFLIFLSRGRREVKPLLLATFVFLVLISPWYLRNFLLLGNPIWPFGGGKYIDPLIAQKNEDHFREVATYLGFSYETPANFLASWRRLFFTFPDNFNSTKYAGLRPLLASLAIPAVLIVFREKRREFYFFVSWLVTILLIFMLLLNRFERYLILAAFPTALLSTLSIEMLLRKKYTKPLAMAFLIIFFTYYLYWSFVWDECIEAGEGEVRAYLSSLGNEERILEICYKDDARLWKWVREHVPLDARIATSDIRWYYYNRSNMIDLDSWELHELQHANSIEEVVRILEEREIDYFIPGKEGEIDHPKLRLRAKFGDSRIYEVMVPLT